MPAHLAVVNAGGWGTALSVLLANAGHPVRLWCRRADLADEIAQCHENRVYLPGVAVPSAVQTTASIADAVKGASAVILVPISRAMRDTARLVAPHLTPGTPVLHATTGLEFPSLSRLSEVIAEELGLESGQVAALSGPTHAEEVGRGMPSAAVIGCTDPAFSALLQELLHRPTLPGCPSSDGLGDRVLCDLSNGIR